MQLVVAGISNGVAVLVLFFDSPAGMVIRPRRIMRASVPRLLRRNNGARPREEARWDDRRGYRFTLKLAVHPAADDPTDASIASAYSSAPLAEMGVLSVPYLSAPASSTCVPVSVHVAP